MAHILLQYTMLSGKVPFQIRSSGDTADTIMKQIKSGQFDLQGTEWNDVSIPAKKIIKGILSSHKGKFLLRRSFYNSVL